MAKSNRKRAQDAAREAVILLGGVGETSRLMNVSRTTVEWWLKRGVPPTRVLEFEAVINVKRQEYQAMSMKAITRHDLRPDIYPEP